MGFTRAGGPKEFVILTDQVNRTRGDLANGEELLDHDCRVVATGSSDSVWSMRPPLADLSATCLRIIDWIKDLYLYLLPS